MEQEISAEGLDFLGSRSPTVYWVFSAGMAVIHTNTSIPLLQ
jgi:hypothetical protein